MKWFNSLLEEVKYQLFIYLLKKKMKRFNSGVNWVNSQIIAGVSVEEILLHLDSQPDPDTFELGAYYQLTNLKKLKKEIPMRQADLTDVASETSELIREHALTQQRLRANGAKRPYADDCIECGDFIPIERQKGTGGTNICAACLNELERKR